MQSLIKSSMPSHTWILKLSGAADLGAATSGAMRGNDVAPALPEASEHGQHPGNFPVRSQCGSSLIFG
jgi:hypothetical protein